MENIYDNPVGIVKKDIYIIKNKINNKVYIGQAKNTHKRFISHCKDPNYTSLIHQAILKYGKENFYYEILESQISNYNEREKYWIKYYNSITPNGYNIAEGGEDPPSESGIKNATATIKNQETLDALKDALRNTQKSYSILAQEFHTNKKTILRINNGISYCNLNENYPLRKTPNLNGQLTQEEILEIIDILKYSYRYYEDIAKQFNISSTTIKEINAGRVHKQENETYPIRDFKNSGVVLFTYEQIDEIIDLLKNSDLSIRKIAEIYNVDHQSIRGINNGSAKRYRRKNEIYPIR